MNMRIAGLLGVMGAFAVLAPAIAAEPADSGVAKAGLYAALVQPIPNATEMVRPSEAVVRGDEASVVEVQYHRRRFYRRHRRYYRR